MNQLWQEKILTQVSHDEATGCWNWCGQISNSGYGKLMIRDEHKQTKTEGAKEISYMAFVGKVPEGSLLRQTCGNRLCVNPAHIESFILNTN